MTQIDNNAAPKYTSANTTGAGNNKHHMEEEIEVQKRSDRYKFEIAEMNEKSPLLVTAQTTGGGKKEIITPRLQPPTYANIKFAIDRKKAKSNKKLAAISRSAKSVKKVIGGHKRTDVRPIKSAIKDWLSF